MSFIIPLRICNSDAPCRTEKSLRKRAYTQEQRFNPGGDQCYIYHGM